MARGTFPPRAIVAHKEVSVIEKRRRWLARSVTRASDRQYRVQVNIVTPGPDSTDFTFATTPGRREHVTIVGYRQDDTGWHVINVPIEVTIHVT